MCAMLLKHFMRIPEFANLPQSELRSLASRVHVLCVPANRWLLQEGRTMHDYFYLLKGCIEILPPRRKVRARGFGKLEHFYPGCSSARTLSATQILRVNAAQHEFLVQTQKGEAALSAGADPWLERFLGSHMMSGLPGSDWRRLLAASEPRQFARGCRVLRRGVAGSECFVIEAGHAVVHDGEHTLCHLSPGDFFGEDALVLGRRRNANVIALSDMQVHAIDQHAFADILLDRLVRFVVQEEPGVVLSLDDPPDPLRPADLQVSLAGIRAETQALDPRQTYFVSGGAERERALCAFLLIQRGFRARPLLS